MENSNNSLFEHYCEITELSVTEQEKYINVLKEHQLELANKLEALINNNNDLTQVFTDSILGFTDENQLASVGDRLTNYQLIQTLGKGGMGQVFKAERCDGKIEQTVAIKFLHPLFYQYQSGKLLLQEAQALAKLNHPNIASIYDIAETENGNAYIIMEYIEGVTLDVYLEQNNLSVDNKLSLFNQIADAVLEAHNHQIIHADIKPSNIIITASGQAKLIDFGVMQLTGELTKSAPKMVTHYLCAMTVNYASPEQLNGEKSTISSDIYGLGGLLYFMLSGKSPFEEVGGALTSKVQQITNKVPENCPITDNVTFKSDVIGIINKALEKHPKERYRTVTDLVNDIQAFQQNKVISVSSSHRFHNAIKFFYRNRIINTALLSVFMIILMALVQLNSKNKQISKEKQSLTNVNVELTKTYTQRDKSIAEMIGEDNTIHLPNPNNLEPEQYIKIMSYMFDDYYYQQNKLAYTRIIDTLIKWLVVQDNIDPLAILLSRYRKALSNNVDQEKKDISEDILRDIMRIEEPLSPKLLVLFTFKNPDVELGKRYLLPLFIRLKKELIISNLSIEELFLFNKAGGEIYSDTDLELSVFYHQKAYQLAKNNTNVIKLWMFIDILYELYTQSINLDGPNNNKLVNLKEELYDLIYKMKNKKIYDDKVSLLLSLEMKQSMENIALLIQKNNITIESSKVEDEVAKARTLRYQSIYIKSLGKYEEAVVIAEKAADLQKSRSGQDNSYFNYFLAAIAYHYLDSGETINALDMIEEQIIPFSTEHEEKDYLGYYQAEFCYRLALIENTKRLKKLCFDGFTNLEESLGIDNYWTRYTASGVVAWYTLQPPNTAEKYYVELLEKEFDELPSKEKVRRGFILERYYISRKNIEKSSYYQLEVQQAIKDYYGSVDAIDRYYHQVMAAELDALKGNKSQAITKLNNIKQKMCGLADINPQKTNYLKLIKNLNQPSCYN